jgi:hypothetical protein
MLEDGRHEESGQLDCERDDSTLGPLSEAEPSVRSETRSLRIAGVTKIAVSLDARAR